MKEVVMGQENDLFKQLQCNPFEKWVQEEWKQKTPIGDTFRGTNNTVSKSDFEEFKQEMVKFSKKMLKRIKSLEDQVLVVRRDNAMEKEFEELKEAWEAYNYMLEKLKTFKAIKDSA